MTQKAFQDYYPDHFSHCYGCGRLNEYGMQIKSYWDGDETVCVHVAKDYHTGGTPAHAYGGLIASLIDCHSMGTAAAAKYRAENREFGTEPALRFVTASLHVNYLLPTPIGGPLEIRSTIKEIKGRKVIVESRLIAGGKVCATGEVVAVQIPEQMKPSDVRKNMSEE
jgi:acyl-coenzyme A thioesterase PaaI-like protein